MPLGFIKMPDILSKDNLKKRNYFSNDKIHLAQNLPDYSETQTVIFKEKNKMLVTYF